MPFIKAIILFCLSAIVATGCIELIEDVSLNEDGGGVYKLTINLNSSQVKINSILAMDSIKGRKVPNKMDIEKSILEFKTALQSEKGISDVKLEANLDDYIFKLTCSFDDYNSLYPSIQNAGNNIQKRENNKEAIVTPWLLSKASFTKKPLFIEDEWRSKLAAEEDNQLLKKGKYTFILRPIKAISTASPETIKIAKNNRAALWQTSVYDLIFKEQEKLQIEW